MTTAADLIKSAYYLASVKDPGEDIVGYEAEIGLEVLNAIIAQWSGLSIYIPTYTTLVVTLSAGVYQYQIEPPITQLLESNLLDSNNVLTQLAQIFLRRQNTLDYPLSVDAQTRPSTIFLDNNKANMIAQMSTLWFFPVPDQTYTATLQVKQALTPYLYDDTVLEIPPFDQKALRYQMANDLSIEFASTLPPNFMIEYKKLMRQLMAANKRDLSVKNRNPFDQRWRRFRPWSNYAR